MRINVTQQHIDRGQPSKPCGCPIALAIIDAVDWCADISVGPLSASMRSITCERQEDWSLDLAGQEFVQAFDRHGGGKVAPFTFEITRWG